jgi:uncharacterized protein YbjQ (UPF0145 family)
MLISKTENIEGKTIVTSHAIVAEETIIDANIFKNMMAKIKNLLVDCAVSMKKLFLKPVEQLFME